MLADDDLGKSRETLSDPPALGYRDAFAQIQRDPNTEILVAENDGAVIGCLQLTYLRGLSRRGATRVLIEAVRIDRPMRGRGLGARLVHEALERARRRGAVMAQLTSDKARSDAHRFYLGLGFAMSHEGFKLDLTTR